MPPRVSVAFAMFCEGYDPHYPTDLRRMTTGIGGWSAEAPPTIELTLAIGLWSAGAGRIGCRFGIRRPDEETVFIGEGDTNVDGPGEMAIMPLKLTLTFERPGIYWAVCEFNGAPIAEVPFAVSEAPPPTLGGAPAATH